MVRQYEAGGPGQGQAQEIKKKRRKGKTCAQKRQKKKERDEGKGQQPYSTNHQQKQSKNGKKIALKKAQKKPASNHCHAKRSDRITKEEGRLQSSPSRCSSPR